MECVLMGAFTNEFQIKARTSEFLLGRALGQYICLAAGAKFTRILKELLLVTASNGTSRRLD